MKTCLLLGLTVLGTLLLPGCGHTQMNYVLSDDSKELDASKQQQLESALDDFFGTPANPKISDALKQVLKTDDTKLAEGAAAYRRRCMHCHGLSGDGSGPTAGTKQTPFLNPRPRDYRRGIYKFTSTDSSVMKPTRNDLLRTLKNGIPGTSMPSFALYPQEELNNILDYVTLLSIRGETERFVADDAKSGTGEINKEAIADNATAIVRNWVAAETKIVNPKIARTTTDNPAAFKESVKRGKDLFLSQKVQCFNCHGKQGRGDGLETDPKKTTDSWGNVSKPADLTLGVFRGGGRPLDLFRRMHDGIKGTPMPAQANNLKEEDIWDLVNYLRTLAYEDLDRAVAQSSSKGHESTATEN